MKDILLTPAMTGISSPDPIKFAFPAKSAPHAGRGGARPLTLTDEMWQQWWQTPSSAEQRAIYIHIPFCRKRCSFCNFFENGANPRKISNYVAELVKQMEIASQTRLAKSRPFDTVYVGGGTPTDMQAEEIALVGEAINTFPLRDGAEITLEGRINGFGDDKFEAALNNGFNRFSFGVQSFNTHVRQTAARIDDRQTLIHRLQTLSQHPSATIVADLIFGLPGQDQAVWQQDLEDVLTSNVHGVDLYQLIGLHGTRLSEQAEKDKIKPPSKVPLYTADAQSRAGMYAYGAQYLESSQWQRLSSCHWRRDDRERSIYNSLAKSGIEILPFGAGAGGSIHGYGLMNKRDLTQWHLTDDAANSSTTAITVPKLVPAMVMSTNPNAKLDSKLKAGLDRGELELTQFEPEFITHLMPLFNAWQTNGLVQLSAADNSTTSNSLPQCLKQTLAGRFWNVNLQTGLFAYLKENPFTSMAQAS